MFHESPLRDRGEGRATGQPQGVGSEAYLSSTSQDPTPEDARKDPQICGLATAIHEISGVAQWQSIRF